MKQSLRLFLGLAASASLLSACADTNKATPKENPVVAVNQLKGPLWKLTKRVTLTYYSDVDADGKKTEGHRLLETRAQEVSDSYSYIRDKKAFDVHYNPKYLQFADDEIVVNRGAHKAKWTYKYSYSMEKYSLSAPMNKFQNEYDYEFGFIEMTPDGFVLKNIHKDSAGKEYSHTEYHYVKTTETEEQDLQSRVTKIGEDRLKNDPASRVTFDCSMKKAFGQYTSLDSYSRAEVTLMTDFTDYARLGMEQVSLTEEEKVEATYEFTTEIKDDKSVNVVFHVLTKTTGVGQCEYNDKKFSCEKETKPLAQSEIRVSLGSAETLKYANEASGQVVECRRKTGN